MVRGVELRRLCLPLVEPFRWHGGVLTERDVIVVRAVGDASEGWGECSALPVPTYSPEWVDGAWDILRTYLVPLILGRPLDAGGVGLSLADIEGHQMAKCAIELAVLDAQLQAAGVSLATHLGATHDRVTAGVAVGYQPSLAALLDEVGHWVGLGYRRAKLKIHPGWDVEAVRAVRAHFPDLLLLVDANGCYRLADADRLAALDEADLLCFEQPLATDDLLGHAAWAGKMKTPVCLDESITSVATVASALALGACRVINIKPSRVGGYLEAVRIHDLCAARHIPVWCGGMYETGIGRHANVALAALANFSIPGDLPASSRLYREDVTEPVVVDADGTIAVPDRPGIGAVLRTDVLDATTVDRFWAGAV